MVRVYTKNAHQEVVVDAVYWFFLGATLVAMHLVWVLEMAPFRITKPAGWVGAALTLVALPIVCVMSLQTLFWRLPLSLNKAFIWRLVAVALWCIGLGFFGAYYFDWWLKTVVGPLNKATFPGVGVAISIGLGIGGPALILKPLTSWVVATLPAEIYDLSKVGDN